MHPRAIYHFDGGSRPNPGRMETAVVTRGQVHFRDDLGIGDNNEAEWLALLHALDLAIAAGVQDALFVGDSALVIEQAKGHWPCRSPQLRPHLLIFQTRAAAIPRIWLKHVSRSKNLAGIALARRRA